MKRYQQALENPAAVFSSPADVVASKELTLEQKVQVLKRWEYDARLIEVAQEENMTSMEPGVLSDVLKALQALGAVHEESGPTKSGGA
jgi:hypothetical protein